MKHGIDLERRAGRKFSGVRAGQRVEALNFLDLFVTFCVKTKT